MSSPTRTRTLNLAVNSRSLYRLSYRGIYPWIITWEPTRLKGIRPAGNVLEVDDARLEEGLSVDSIVSIYSRPGSREKEWG